jgi:hypothetical protein
MQAAYFLVPNHNHPAEEFSFTEKKRNPKIAVLVSHAGAHTLTSTDLFDADTELAQRLSQMLTKFYKDNRDSVQIIPPYKVQGYRSKHPEDWNTKGPAEIGKELGADFVINLEITRLSLYDEKSSGLRFQGQALMYQGKVEIEVTVVDVNNPEEGMLLTKFYRGTYPSVPEPATDCTVGAFKDRFFVRIARDLSRWFAAHPSEAKQGFD